MRTELQAVGNEAMNVVALNHGSPLLQGNMFVMMLQLAEVMAKSNTLPQHFHNKPGDCLRVIELAHRIGQSPYAIADGSYVIQGKFAMDGKTMASIINSHPSILGSLNYTYQGDKSDAKSYICTVSGKLKSESEPRTVEVSLSLGLSDSKGARARWEKDPDQMLAYYGARVWARRHAPEVIGGLYTPDELKTIEPEYEVISKPYYVDKPSPGEPLVIEPSVSIEDQLDAMLESLQTASTQNELKRLLRDAWKFAKEKAPYALEGIKDIAEARKEFLAAEQIDEDVPQ